MKRFFAFFTVFSILVPFAFSVPLESLVSPAHAAQLQRHDNARITETQLKNPAPKLMPNNSALRQLAAGNISAINPSMMVETLYLYSKPEHLHTSESLWDEDQKVKVFNQIIAVSTLEGIQYYSLSRGSMRTFYEYSSIIDGPVSKNPVPDPVYSQIPATLTLFARQKDLTFGDNIYRYDFVTTREAVFFTQENITALTYGFIPVIGKGNLRSVMAIFDCGDSFLVYTISMAKALSVPGMGDRVSGSFSNRADAVLTWFKTMLDSGL